MNKYKILNKISFVLGSLILLILISTLPFWDSGASQITEGYQDLKESTKGSAERVESRQEPSYFEQRLLRSGYNKKQAKAALIEARLHISNGIYNQPWTLVGPNTGVGRITDVEFDPTSESVYYAGAASGGLFKTVNKGATWTNIFKEAPFLSISDLALAPSNSNILYLATGEANGTNNSIVYNGYGVYKSIDAGVTWTHLGLEDTDAIGRVVVHPTNPNIVFVAATGAFFANDTSRGVYRTLDGGKTWKKVLYVSTTSGGSDIVINKENPNIVVASIWDRAVNHPSRNFTGKNSGIYRSTDGGETWQQSTQGLPSVGTVLGRISLAQFESDPNIMYSMVTNGGLEGLYRSNNAGASWSRINTNGLSIVYGEYCSRMEVHPDNANIIYIVDLNLYKSTNGGANWSNVNNNMHVDFHTTRFHPTNPNLILVGSDGGFYSSENSGSNWKMATGLPITQFYQMAVDPNDPNKIFGGTQDNGTRRTTVGGEGPWGHVSGGDGFYVLVDPNNSNTVYAESQFGNIGRSDNGGASFSDINGSLFSASGERFAWNTPMILDPSNTNTIYFGSQKVWRSLTKGGNWQAMSDDLSNGSNNDKFGTITTIDVSTDGEFLLVGTDDGNVWKSENKGSTWQKINQGLPTQWVTRVHFDPGNKQRAFVTFSGFKNNDHEAHVFITEDLGASWKPIQGNLPEIPVNDILVDKDNPQTLFVATDGGVFISPNTGAEWFRLGLGLPNSPILDFDVHWRSRTLYAATYGSSIHKVKIDDIVNVADATFSGSSLLTLSAHKGQVKIKLKIESSEKGHLTLMDVMGKVMKKWPAQSYLKGEHEIEWNYQNEGALSAGTYVIVYRSAKQLLTSKINLP